jgi:hypothetical protein
MKRSILAYLLLILSGCSNSNTLNEFNNPDPNEKTVIQEKK